MNINRHNYESFFLLYADNELTAAEKKAVEIFVQQNPDLEKELELLQQSVLRPESGVVFAGKEDLMRSEHPVSTIHTGNYESFFLLYADNELDVAGKKTVEAFLDLHPQYQGELELLHAARMSPDTSIVYEGKQDLYRREERVKVVPFAWWRLAAAAVVLLLLGFWWMNRQKTVPPAPIARGTNNKPVQHPATQQAPAPLTARTSAAVPVSPAPPVQQATVTVNKTKSTNRRQSPPAPQLTNNLPVVPDKTNDLPQLASNDMDNNGRLEKPGPLPEHPRNAIDIKTVKAPGRGSLLNGLAGIGRQDDDNPVAQFASYDKNDQIDILTTSVKKTSLRGILRKASRIIAKKTSTDDDTDDDQKHILIGSFAIAVK